MATVAVAPSASSHSATSAKPLATPGAKAIAKLPMPIQPATSSAHAQARAAVSRSDGVRRGWRVCVHAIVSRASAAGHCSVWPVVAVKRSRSSGVSMSMR